MALTKVGKEGVTGISNSSNATAINISASENVGINTSVNSLFNAVGGIAKLAVTGESSGTSILGNTDASIAIINTDQTANNTAGLHFARADTDDTPNYAGASIVAQFPDAQVTGQYPKGELAFLTSTTANAAPSEKMRLDSSGNLLVGQSSTTVPGAGNTTAGTSIRGTDGVFISRTTSDTGASALQVNKTTGTGAIINLSSGGTTAGSVGVANTSEVYFTASGGNGTGLYMSNGSTVVPMNGGSVSDNTVDCGHPSYRFDNIRATNGTIQTSDQNEKQQIASLTTAEITAAKAISALFKTFKWKDKVESKGNAARIHTGVIAQEVQTAMSNAGLDAADYAFWCSDTWTDDDGNSQTRMGIHYPELLAFVGAATEQRLANIESRLTALEAE